MIVGFLLGSLFYFLCLVKMTKLASVSSLLFSVLPFLSLPFIFPPLGEKKVE